MTSQADNEPNAITAYAHDTLHVLESLNSLYVQHRSKPIIRALLTSYANRVQEIEDALWDLLTKTSLDTAFGDGLDALGDLLLFPRGALTSDSDYRSVLRAAVLTIRSRGVSEDVIQIVSLVLGATFSWTYHYGYASIWIEPHAPFSLAPGVFMKLLRRAKSAGVQIELITPPLAESSLFTFSTDPFRIVSDASLGFSDTTQVAGGHLTGVVN